MKVQVYGVSCVDGNDEYFADGSEQFMLRVNVKRGTPEWDTLFESMRLRVPVQVDLRDFCG